jgi:DNA polymerase-3 subunit beta
MHFKIERSKLLELINTVFPAVSKSDSIQVTKCIRISVSNEVCVMAATDLVMTIKSCKPVRMMSEGAVGVSGKALHSLVAQLPEGEIEFRLDDTRLGIKFGKSKFNLNTIAPDQFPETPVYGNFNFREIPADFFDKIDTVLYAASKDQQRVNINGVHITKEDVVATDGHRLAIVPLGMPLESPITIVSDTMPGIIKALSYGEGTIGVFHDRNSIHFRKGDVGVSTRLISSLFPEYKLIIPSTEFKPITMPLEELRNALKRVTIASNGLNQIDFDYADGVMTVSAKSPEIGEAVEEIQCSSDGVIQFRLNGVYLSEAIDKLKEKTITFEFRTPLMPLVVRENGYTSIIMPQRR